MDGGEGLTMDYTKDVLEEWVEALANPRRRLTDWDDQFLEIVSDQLRRQGVLSGQHAEILERIYAEKT